MRHSDTDGLLNNIGWWLDFTFSNKDSKSIGTYVRDKLLRTLLFVLQ